MNGSVTMEIPEETTARPNRVSGIDVEYFTDDVVKSLRERSESKKLHDICGGCNTPYIRMVFAILPNFDGKGSNIGNPSRVNFPECAYSCCVSTPT